jgi:peptidoglycan/xylan/chitin deacetylase (PgdA/CDA1 family)
VSGRYHVADTGETVTRTPLPAFLITVDTEGDNLWARPSRVTTRNAQYLPRFQVLCESYGLKPTYLTNWEMAHSPAFRESGQDVLARGAGEIGMHLHAWDSPPLVPLTADDNLYQPYLIEYPDGQMREKVRVMTAALEEAFGVKPVSHRAGRWSFDDRYARILIEHGYRVDCSVTPYISWSSYPGDPSRNGGSDFSAFPDASYFVDLADISRPGASTLLEVPVTVIRPRHPHIENLVRPLLERRRFGKRVFNNLFPRMWLYPGRKNWSRLADIIDAARRERRPYVELALHSSQLMPSGSPNFPSADSIEALYESLERLFAAAHGIFHGATLAEYHDAVARSDQANGTRSTR